MMLGSLNTATAKVGESTEGKACPDINLDTCCESGQGNCLETVVITIKKSKL